MKNLVLVMVAVLVLSGCAQNPCGPQEISANEKAAEWGSYEETIDRLDNPTVIDAWIFRNRKYDFDKWNGWTDPSGKSQVDNADSLARALFDKSGLTCGNFTGFVCACARVNGMECGGISYSGHIIAWIKYNDYYYRYDNGNKLNTIFSTFADLQFYIFKLHPYAEYWDDRLVKIDQT